MNPLAVLVWIGGLVLIIGVSMWADQKTRAPFWAILTAGIIASVILGHYTANLL